MKKNKSFRKQIGFSQDIYSIYLGISKGMLTLVELNLRTFPATSSLKNAYLFLRWVAFEKVWTPPPPEKDSVEGARKVLQKKLDNLLWEKRKRAHHQKIKDSETIDYQKANAFLKEELARNEEPDDALFLNLTLRANQQKLPKNPLLDSIQQSLADRFLDFQISEYQRSLDDLGSPPLQI